MSTQIMAANLLNAFYDADVDLEGFVLWKFDSDEMK